MRSNLLESGKQSLFAAGNFRSRNVEIKRYNVNRKVTLYIIR